MYVIMYHYVRSIRNSRYPGIKGLEVEEFKEQLDFLQQNNFRFVSMQDVIDRKNISEKSVLLTFDDGYIDHYTNVFPILRTYGISGFFSMPGKIIREKKVLDVNKIHFILANAPVPVLKQKLFERLDFYRSTEFPFALNQELYNKLAIPNRFDDKDTIFIKRTLQVEMPEMLRNIITEELFREYVTKNEAVFVDELYMNLPQIRLMKECGMEFGIHGYDHYWMNRLSEKGLELDIEAALQVFDGIVPRQGWTCCYPYGSYSDEVIRQVCRRGAAAGLATDVRVYEPEKEDIFRIPRLDTNDFPPRTKNYMSREQKKE